MTLISHLSKPHYNASLPPLCNFSIEKAYLWSLIRDKLNELSTTSLLPISILDAACHSLITRRMFPASANYYGIDVSISRLKLAFKQKQSGDVLYLGDLTLPLNLNSCFDVVVSCNTLSHLPPIYLNDALNNLIRSVKSNGYFIVNIGLSRDFQSVAHRLLDSFSSVETVFLGTKSSREIDSHKNLEPSDIPSLVAKYEQSVPNNACLHSQVLFYASNKTNVNRHTNAPGSPSKILRLNSIPESQVLKYSSDSDLVAKLTKNNEFDLILFSDSLYNSSIGSTILSQITHLSSLIYTITSVDIPFRENQQICFLGFEMAWVGDQAKVRLVVNTIRRISGVSLTFLIVDSRNGVTCRPSLILDDL